MGRTKRKAVVEKASSEEDEAAPAQEPEQKKPKIRARKLFHPFMSYLKSYKAFALTLPRRFTQFDEDKRLAQEEQEKDKEENDEKGDSSHEEDEPAPDNDNKRLQFGSATRAKTIVELKERLEQFKGKKLEYQERLKKKGIKSRLTKKQRLEERAKLKKEKSKVKRAKGNLFKPTAVAVNVTETEVKPVIEPKMVFSKLELPQVEGHKKRTNRDPKRMLQKIQKSESKLKYLEEKGKTEVVKRIKEKMSWDKAIQKAEGVKLKDDVELLKKSIRKKEDIKGRSKKKWDERLGAMEQRKTDSQKKRKENITKRNKEKKQKKIKRSIKKGRVVL